jgi:5-methylcytosine-specific restriction endonuclease McrA
MYCRYGTFNIHEVLKRVINEPRITIKKRLKNTKAYKQLVQANFKDYLVKMDSLRYQLFKQKGTTCVKCGLKASYFALESHKSDTMGKDTPSCHFNLYGVLNGREVLFTKDHILPKSKGGKNTLENMQPMCLICNNLKGNNIT